MLRYQLKNTIYTPAMAAAILVQCFFMMVGLYPKANADMVYNLQQSMTLGYGWLFISVTSVVPLCFFLHFGGRRQEIYMAVSRSTYRTYVRASALNAVLSGMAVAVGACLLFTIICGIWSSDMTPFFGVGMGAQEDGVWGWLTKHPELRYAAMCGIYMIQGGLWPMVSLSCFGFTENTYMSVAIPFTLRTILNYLAQMLELTMLSPVMTRLISTSAAQLPWGGFIYLLGYVVLVWCVCIGSWVLRLRREVRGGKSCIQWIQETAVFFKIVYYSGDPVFVHLHGLWRNQWISDATGTNSSGGRIVCFWNG